MASVFVSIEMQVLILCLFCKKKSGIGAFLVITVTSQSDSSVIYWPVHAEGAQVENGDAHRGFLQEGHQLAQPEAKGSVVKGKSWRQELIG